MGLLLWLNIPKSPWAVPLSDPPPQWTDTLPFPPKRVLRHTAISLRSMCAKFLGCTMWIHVNSWVAMGFSGPQQLPWTPSYTGPHIPMAPSTFQKCSTYQKCATFQKSMSRWLSNRFGPPRTNTTRKKPTLALYGVVGRWKVTKTVCWQGFKTFSDKRAHWVRHFLVIFWRWELIVFQVKEKLMGCHLSYYVDS